MLELRLTALATPPCPPSVPPAPTPSTPLMPSVPTMFKVIASAGGARDELKAAIHAESASLRKEANCTIGSPASRRGANRNQRSKAIVLGDQSKEQNGREELRAASALAGREPRQAENLGIARRGELTKRTEGWIYRSGDDLIVLASQEVAQASEEAQRKARELARSAQGNLESPTSGAK
jgi:hypothetical protein